MVLLPFSCFRFIFCQVFFFSCVSCLEKLFQHFCKAGLVVLNSLNFCLSVKLLIFPSNLNESLAEQSILGFSFFPFITLNILCHSLLACRTSVEKSAVSLMGVTLYVICHSSLIAFNSLSLSVLITMCLGVFLLGFFLPGTLCFLDLVDYFLSHVREVFNYYLFKYFLRFLLSLFSFWDPCNVNVGVFNVDPEVFQIVFIFSFLFLFSVLWQ